MSFDLRFALPNQPPQVVSLAAGRTLIGTLMSNQIVLRAAGVDPIHAMIESTDGLSVVLTDLGSRSGVKLNGKAINVEERLSSGDIIIVGNVSLEVVAAQAPHSLLPIFPGSQADDSTIEPTALSKQKREPLAPMPATPFDANNSQVYKETVRRSPTRDEKPEERGDLLFSPRKARPAGNVLEVVAYWDDTILDVELFHPKIKGYEQVVIGDNIKAHFLAGGKDPLPLHRFVELKGEGYRVRQVDTMEGRYRRGGKVESVDGKASVEMGRRDIAHIRFGAISYFIMFVQPPAMDLPRQRARDPIFVALLSFAMLMYLIAVPLLWMTKPKPVETTEDDVWSMVNAPSKLEKPKPEPPKPEAPKPPPPPPKPEQKIVEKKIPPPPKPPAPPPPPPKPVEAVAKEKPQQQKPVEKAVEKPTAAVQPLKPAVAPAKPEKAAPAKEGMAAANDPKKADIKKPGPPTKSNDLKTGGAAGSGNQQRGGERKGDKAVSTMGVEGPKNDKPSGVNLSKLGLGAGKILDKTGPGAISTNMKSSAGGAGGGSGSGAKTRGLGGIGGSGSLGLAGAAGELNNFGSGSGGTGSGQGGLGGLGGNGIGSGFGDRGASGKGRANVEIPPGDPVVDGGLTQQEVQAVIRANLNQIRHCYEQLLQRSPSASGKVKVQFVVATNGRVSSADIVSTSINDSVMKGCVSGAVTRWAFPKPRGGQPVTVTYPFVFNPI